MKKLLGLIFAIIIMFSACKKDEIPAPVNTDAIKAQLSAVSIPSKEVVQAYLASTNLKSTADANPAATLVEIFGLDKNTYEYYGDYAIKPFLYYEMNSDCYRLKFLTGKQRFTVKNGIVDTTKYTMSFEVGCPYSEYFNLSNCNYINQTIVFFRSDNGRQFAYFTNENGCSIKLPPIAGGKWQISVNYYTDGVSQTYMSEMIDFYTSSRLINLKFPIRPENTVSILKLKISSKDLIKNANYIELIGIDDQMNSIYFDYPFSYDEKLPDIISFPAPFEIKSVRVCGIMYGCWTSGVKLSPDSPVKGPKIYVLN